MDIGRLKKNKIGQCVLIFFEEKKGLLFFSHSVAQEVTVVHVICFWVELFQENELFSLLKSSCVIADGDNQVNYTCNFLEIRVSEF